jgi:hypothetical protein
LISSDFKAVDLVCAIVITEKNENKTLNNIDCVFITNDLFDGINESGYVLRHIIAIRQ